MLIDRMFRAARLDVNLYEEVERDTAATNQALLVVVLVAVAGGIGSLTTQGIGGLLFGIVVSVIVWAVWAFLTFWIGTTFLGGTATWGELLRTLGFAYTPGVLNIFGIIPGLGQIISLVASIWILVAGIIAVRQALDFSTAKAVITVIIGWVIMIVLTFVLTALWVGLALVAS